jgi:7-carboxy-7-deazaguanine synthase
MKTYPVSEIFGPTVQGEGRQVGKICYFVRFAGCDFNCSWCDTKYAIGPKYEGWKKTDMTAKQIVTAVEHLKGESGLVVLTGGNPALFVDEDLIREFRDGCFELAMETQGTIITNAQVELLDELTISPKPPSSGMSDKTDWTDVALVCIRRRKLGLPTTLKFVVFGGEDIEWIKTLAIPNAHRYISIGTLPGALAVEVLDYTRRVVEDLAKDDFFGSFSILPQLHYLLWGNKRGV